MGEEKVEVVVVAIDNLSWDILLKKKFYAFPKSSRKVGKYFAFYRHFPISAITHYAKVSKAEEGETEDVGTTYWLHCFPDAEPPFQIVRFEKLIKLRSPVKKDSIHRGGKGHIQGRVYTTLNKLLKAKTISEFR